LIKGSEVLTGSAREALALLTSKLVQPFERAAEALPHQGMHLKDQGKAVAEFLNRGILSQANRIADIQGMGTSSNLLISKNVQDMTKALNILHPSAMPDILARPLYSISDDYMRALHHNVPTDELLSIKGILNRVNPGIIPPPKSRNTPPSRGQMLYGLADMASKLLNEGAAISPQFSLDIKQAINVMDPKFSEAEMSNSLKRLGKASTPFFDEQSSAGPRRRTYTDDPDLWQVLTHPYVKSAHVVGSFASPKNYPGDMDIHLSMHPDWEGESSAASQIRERMGILSAKRVPAVNKLGQITGEETHKYHTLPETVNTPEAIMGPHAENDFRILRDFLSRAARIARSRYGKDYRFERIAGLTGLSTSALALQRENEDHIQAGG
jgi:hypothetical protein